MTICDIHLLVQRSARLLINTKQNTHVYKYIYINTHTVNRHILYLSLSVTYLDCKSHWNHHQVRNCHWDFLAPTLSPYGEGADDGSPGAPWKLADQDFDLDPKTDNLKRKMLGGKVQKVEKVTKKHMENDQKTPCFLFYNVWCCCCLSFQTQTESHNSWIKLSLNRTHIDLNESLQNSPVTF